MNLNPTAALLLAARMRELAAMVRQTGDYARAGDCESSAALIEGVVTAMVPPTPSKPAPEEPPAP